MKTPFFIKNVRFFRLGFLEKLKLKGESDCYKGVFDPILNSTERLKFNMSAFLQCLPSVLK